jgi:peptidyl-prolyl cis-trans isomerase C
LPRRILPSWLEESANRPDIVSLTDLRAGGTVSEMRSVCLLAAATSVMAACQGASKTPPPSPPPAEAPLAVVNGQPIPWADFERKLESTTQRYRRADKDLRPELVENVRQNLARRMIEAELIRQKAVEWEVEPTLEEIEEAWAEHRARFGSDEGFSGFLARAGTTEEALRDDLVHNLRRRRLFAKVQAQPVTEAELRTYYDEHPSYVKRAAEVRVAQILVRVPHGLDATARAPYAERAERIAKAVRKGMGFDQAVQEAGGGAAGLRNGDLGFQPRNRLPKEVADVAFDQLEMGQVSKVIETGFGFHIIKKLDLRPERTLPFEEARADIRNRMNGQRRNVAIRNALAEWKSKATIETRFEVDLTRPNAAFMPHRGPGRMPGQEAPRLPAPEALRVKGRSVDR